MSDNFPTISTPIVPGQGVLPGFEEILGVESSALKKPQNERFCWAFVTNGGKTAEAYQEAINPEAERLTAQKRASDLLKKPEISGRIKEISTIIQRKYELEVIASAMRAMRFDPAVFFDESGSERQICDVQDHHRCGIGLKSRLVDGDVRYLPVFPSPEKARQDLQKMFGLSRDKLEMTGKNGGPIETASLVTVYLPDNGRDDERSDD